LKTTLFHEEEELKKIKVLGNTYEAHKFSKDTQLFLQHFISQLIPGTINLISPQLIYQFFQVPLQCVFL